MEFPSGSRLRRSPPPPPGGARLPLSSDRISALSDDMILLILSRLGSVRAAARTGILSRRWRRILTQLADLAFCAGVADNIQAALARFSAAPAISSIQVRSPVTRDPISLMRAAALLSPAELVFVLKEELRLPGCSTTNLVLPCFHRATRMELDVGLLGISPPVAAGEFAALEKLSLAGHIPDLGTLLSRCPRLRVLGVTFRGVRYLGSLEAALDVLEAAAGLKLSFLGVDTRSLTYALKAAQFTPLLRAMGRLSPQKLVFTDDFGECMEAADLPCFHRATSIDMNLPGVRFTTLSDGMFSALERFSLSRGCNIVVDLDTFVSRCPRLRVLKVTVATGDITVHSTSLQVLEVTGNMECHRIDIAAPMLKQLGLTVEAGCGTELSVSILTPMVEKVSWKRWYTTSSLMFGFWHLECARLESTHDQDMCSQLPRIHALSLHISPVAKGRMGSRPNFEKEMEKLLITDFSVLDLRLHTCGHVFGSLVLRILRMHRIRAATEKLKIVLLESPLDKQGWTIICPCADLKRQACPKSCPCTNPKNWRAQSISLPRLEEVEIEGFNGEHHEHAFLGFISKCSPMLKRVTLRLPSGFGCSTAEIYSIFLAYPSVKCYVYSCLGELVPQASSVCIN